MSMGNVAINGVRMLDMDNVPAAIDFRIARGSVEVWEVVNTSGMAHPLHVHNQQFQVVDIAGAAPPPSLRGWKDTVLIPPNQTVRLLLHFAWRRRCSVAVYVSLPHSRTRRPRHDGPVFYCLALPDAGPLCGLADEDVPS